MKQNFCLLLETGLETAAKLRWPKFMTKAACIVTVLLGMSSCALLMPGTGIPESCRRKLGGLFSIRKKTKTYDNNCLYIKFQRKCGFSFSEMMHGAPLRWKIENRNDKYDAERRVVKSSTFSKIQFTKGSGIEDQQSVTIEYGPDGEGRIKKQINWNEPADIDIHDLMIHEQDNKAKTCSIMVKICEDEECPKIFWLYIKDDFTVEQHKEKQKLIEKTKNAGISANGKWTIDEKTGKWSENESRALEAAQEAHKKDELTEVRINVEVAAAQALQSNAQPVATNSALCERLSAAHSQPNDEQEKDTSFPPTNGDAITQPEPAATQEGGPPPVPAEVLRALGLSPPSPQPDVGEPAAAVDHLNVETRDVAVSFDDSIDSVVRNLKSLYEVRD